MDAINSFSNKAGDLMEEVYEYMMQKCYMYLLEYTEGRKRSIRRQVCHCCFFPTVSLRFVVVLALHYKLNFPFHCAT